ncbi:MAG: Fic family protein [Terracidiphilus sp.]
MDWNWQSPDWPNFTWDPARLAAQEQAFLLHAGLTIGSTQHLGDEERDRLLVERMSGEALTTSRIEGELLDRDSVQSSIQRQLGLKADRRRIPPAERGIAEMMVALYRSYSEPLSATMLFGWHRMLAEGRRDLSDIGRYRTSAEPMQIVSGPAGSPRVHYEAPPSARVPAEMARLIEWFNRTAPGEPDALPALTRAGLAHLRFELIHPFEDGNGRLGRSLAEKALAQAANRPLLTGLASAILAHQKRYYEALERADRTLDASGWLDWFARTALDAQQSSLRQVEFLLAKTRLLDRLCDQLNPRQRKALLRMFEAGPQGFEGGMSAGKYSTVTGASPATTTRDLAELVDRGALARRGARKYARYSLKRYSLKLD